MTYDLAAAESAMRATMAQAKAEGDNEQVAQMRALRGTMTIAAIGRMFSIHPNYAAQILRGVRRKA